jgi:hypothetical protein
VTATDTALQGVLPFEANGLEHPAPLPAELSYVEHDDVSAQAFRLGSVRK